MDKVLVTGGAGYIGSVLVPDLLSQGYQVTVFDSLLYGGSGLLPFVTSQRFSLLKGDIRDREALSTAIQKSDIVIHLAAIVGLPGCNKDPHLAESTNVQGTKNVADLLSPSQLLIQASTVSNYGANPQQVCDESTPLNPVSCYGKTKSEAEKIVMDFPQTICLRIATAFGVSPRMRLDLLINDFVHQAYFNRVLILFEKSYTRTFIHVQDISRSILFSLQNAGRMKNGIFNIGDNGNNFSKEEIALKIKERIHFYLHFAAIGEDEDRRNYCVSYEKINALGFKAEKTVDEGIDELIKACPVFEYSHPLKNY